VSLWIRANFAEQSALWEAADRLTKAGVPAAEIDERGTEDTWPVTAAPLTIGWLRENRLFNF
jgi:hypothetical protein